MPAFCLYSNLMMSTYLMPCCRQRYKLLAFLSECLCLYSVCHFSHGGPPPAACCFSDDLNARHLFTFRLPATCQQDACHLPACRLSTLQPVKLLPST
jgi:hypothetical protein